MRGKRGRGEGTRERHSEDKRNEKKIRKVGERETTKWKKEDLGRDMMQ